jgi:glycopeptide antibiotics resistance protein
MDAMRQRLISALALVAYGALLIKVMVFKNVPMIRMGHLMLNFGGADANGQANFVPFKTILPYLLGHKGWIIAGINLAGNVGLLVPIGFLAPFAFSNMSWKKALILGAASGLLIEGMQVAFRVGIFDVDDVILNGLGVVVGFAAFRLFIKR